MALPLDALIRLLLLAALGAACVLILQPFAEILVWASLLAVILKPLHVWLQRRLRLGRWWAAGLIVVVGLLVLLGPVGALAAALLEHLLKPLLMARGLPVPMLVILAGVLGGTLKAGLAGLAGLIQGPVLLSLGYHFVRLWVGTDSQPAS